MGLPLHVSSPLSVEEAAEIERVRATNPELADAALQLCAYMGVRFGVAVDSIRAFRAALSYAARAEGLFRQLLQRTEARRVHTRYRQKRRHW
jgi:hypothetical protein